eukprot:1371170-Amorphochlora_amoeboformis.AAC.1
MELTPAADLPGVLLEALADPTRFTFGTILTMENLAKDKKTEKWFNLVKLFAHGAYSDYLDQKKDLPDLKDEHITKIRQLTILSLAAKNTVYPSAYAETCMINTSPRRPYRMRFLLKG